MQAQKKLLAKKILLEEELRSSPVLSDMFESV